MRAAALLLALPVMCAAQDSWTGRDKPKHFAASFALGFVAEGVLHDRLPVWGRFAAAFAPGLVKELDDPKFSAKDLAWDAIGVYAGMQASGWIIRRNSITFKAEF